MPSRTTKIVAAAIATSTLASSFLRSDGFTPSALAPVFRRVDPATTTTSLNYLDRPVEENPAPAPLAATTQQQQMEHIMWIQIHSYLVSTYQDYREWPEIAKTLTDLSEADQRKFNIEPKAIFAQVTYRYSMASPEIKAALQSDFPHVLDQWKVALSNYYALLVQIHAKKPIHPMMHMSIMSMLYLNSQEVLSKLRHHYGGTFESIEEQIHPQQWLRLSDRFQHIFQVEHHRKTHLVPLRAYGKRISPFWNARAPGFSKSFATDAEFSPILKRYNELAKALISGQVLTPEQMIEHDFLMTKLVFSGEPWLNDQKEQKLARFNTPQEYTKQKNDLQDEKNGRPNVFRFEAQEYDATRDEKEESSKTSSMLTFDHHSETEK